MRITSQMMVNNFVANLHRNLAELNKVRGNWPAGRNSNGLGRSSGVTRSMTLQAKLLENAQYARNIDEALAIFETSEIALNNVSSVLARAGLSHSCRGLLADEDRGPSLRSLRTLTAVAAAMPLRELSMSLAEEGRYRALPNLR